MEENHHEHYELCEVEDISRWVGSSGGGVTEAIGTVEVSENLCCTTQVSQLLTCERKEETKVECDLRYILEQQGDWSPDVLVSDVRQWLYREHSCVFWNLVDLPDEDQGCTHPGEEWVCRTVEEAIQNALERQRCRVE